MHKVLHPTVVRGQDLDAALFARPDLTVRGEELLRDAAEQVEGVDGAGPFGAPHQGVGMHALGIAASRQAFEDVLGHLRVCLGEGGLSVERRQVRARNLVELLLDLLVDLLGQHEIFVRDLVHERGVAHVDVPAPQEDVDHVAFAGGRRQKAHLESFVVADDHLLVGLADDRTPERELVAFGLRPVLHVRVR